MTHAWTDRGGTARSSSKSARDAIEQHIDEEVPLATRELEAADQRTLGRFVKRMRKSA